MVAEAQAATVPYDSVQIDELRARGSSKWRRYDADVLAAWVAEMDYPLAPPIRAALAAAVDRSYSGYPPPEADTGLPAACAAWLAAAGLHVEAKQVHLLPDVLKGLELAVDAFSPPGSPVIVPTPAYGPFFAVSKLCGRPIIEAPMRDDGERRRFDLDAVARGFAAGAKTIIVCNPHNPVGRVFERAELAELAEVVQAHGGRVVADEIHCPLVYPGHTYTPYASVSPAAAAHTATLVSASKGWNVPGLKCAQIVLSNPADLATWELLPSLRTHGVSVLGIVANLAAYTEGGPWLRETLAYLDKNRRHLGALLAELLPEVRYRMPEGTYLAWLDCRQLGLDRPAAFFLEHARVAVSEGAGFGPPGGGFVRFNFATSAALLERMVRAMAAAVRAR